MLLCDKPLKATEIAKEAKKEFNPTMMHLLGLARMGYVASPEKGLYQITEKGKKFLGIPETTKEKALQILTYQPHEKAFNFYATIGEPLNLHAHSLRDFANKIEKADIISIKFHLERADFETWFKGIGDEELAAKTKLLKKQHISDESLRHELHEMVEQRYLQLAQLSGQPIPPEDLEHAHTH